MESNVTSTRPGDAGEGSVGIAVVCVGQIARSIAGVAGLSVVGIDRAWPRW